MNSLTSKQRKLCYLVGILVLMGPIVYLGMPGDGSRNKLGEALPSGGVIARQRIELNLGESTLGKVDPASATMNLVLLGLRGVATNLLWMEAEELKKTKNWFQLQSTVDSIILLQPHFKTVWEYQAWNLGFNVSAECDAVEDRFFWVKEGFKFLKRGTEINRKVPELFFYAGEFAGNKMGKSDEKETFRRFFLSDPDKERWKGGADTDINPDGKDNFMVGRDWFLKANELVEHGIEQHRMDLPLFRAYPYHMLMEYGTARNEDGIFDEKSLNAWKLAFKEWTEEYGRAHIRTFGGDIMMEASDEDLEQISKEEFANGLGFNGKPFTLETKKHWKNHYQNMTQYRYWKLRCDMESKPDLGLAKQDLVAGKKEYRDNQNMTKSRELIESGLKKLEDVVTSPDYKNYVRPSDNLSRLWLDEPDLVELALKSILIWHSALENLGEKPPEEFPLKEIWVSEEFKEKRKELNEKFLKWQGSLGASGSAK